MAGRGRKINQVKNFVAHKEWMEGKKIGRPKQEWVPWKFDPVGGQSEIICPLCRKEREIHHGN